MKTGRMIIILAVSLVFVLSAFWGAGKSINAQQDDADIAALSKKIDNVLSNQQSIMQSIASIKEELTLIKIRVTQAQ